MLSDILDGLTEKIPRCGELVANDLCGWDCCHFADNYILFLPGEWESAQQLGHTVGQHEILDPSYHGGIKAIPRDRGCCSHPAKAPSAYKPLDCRLYPYWFQIENNQLLLIQGRKCPIINRGEHIDQHREEAIRTGERLVENPDLATFFEHARMVGYGHASHPQLRMPSRSTAHRANEP